MHLISIPRFRSIKPLCQSFEVPKVICNRIKLWLQTHLHHRVVCGRPNLRPQSIDKVARLQHFAKFLISLEERDWMYWSWRWGEEVTRNLPTEYNNTDSKD